MTLAEKVKIIQNEGRGICQKHAGALEMIKKYEQLVKDGYITEEGPQTFGACKVSAYASRNQSARYTNRHIDFTKKEMRDPAPPAEGALK